MLQDKLYIFQLTFDYAVSKEDTRMTGLRRQLTKVARDFKESDLFESQNCVLQNFLLIYISFIYPQTDLLGSTDYQTKYIPKKNSLFSK